MIKNGPKLVSEKKTEELQMLSQMNGERQLNKNRSKKDLKNKFKSSSAIYSNGAKMIIGEPENEEQAR